MPRIDPQQLLKTLSVLLGPHGGIKSEEEVSRLVQLMHKFSKKLVSKVVYIKILRSSSPELLDKFLNEKGWDLLNFWFTDAIKTNNWPLCKELIELFLLCPMTAQRLRDNNEVNIAPRLVRQLTCDSRVENLLRTLSTQVLNKWMEVVQTPTAGSNIEPVRTRARVQIVPPPAPNQAALENSRTRGGSSSATRGTRQESPIDAATPPKVPVTVHTESTAEEEIRNLSNLGGPSSLPEHVDPLVWEGKARRGYPKAKPRQRFRPPPVKLKVVLGKSKTPKVVVNYGEGAPAYKGGGDYEKALEAAQAKVDKEDEDFTIDSEEDDSDDDLEFRELMRRSTNALDRTSSSSSAGPGAVTRLEPIKPLIISKKLIAERMAADAASSDPGDAIQSSNKESLSEMRTQSSMNGDLKDELAMDIDDLLDDAPEESLSANQKSVTDSVKVERSNSITDSISERATKEEKEVVQKPEKQEKSKERTHDSKSRREEKRSKDKKSDKDRKHSSSSHSSSSKEDERRRREREERRKREKEKERERRRKEEKRSYKDSEMRRDLDSSERAKIKAMAQKLKEESQAKKDADQSKPPLSVSSLPKIPKLSSSERSNSSNGSSSKSGSKVESATKKTTGGLSFEELMGAMDAGGLKTKGVVKAPPIKNKNRDLLASFSSSSGTKATPKPVSKPTSVPGRSSPLSTSAGSTTTNPDYLKEIMSSMRTEDKSSMIIPASSFEKSTNKEESAIVGEKRRASDEDAVPRIKVKSPSQLKESPMFGDILGTIMKDDQPKKKKLKLAELKAKNKEEEDSKVQDMETAISESGQQEQEKAASPVIQPAFSFYRDTMEEDVKDDEAPTTDGDQSTNTDEQSSEAKAPESPDQEDLPFEEPASALPREVRGILVHSKGSGRPGGKRNLTWRDLDGNRDLVEVEYFELDETERVNVNKLKFEEMRKKENLLEKSSLHTKAMMKAEEEIREWPGLLVCDYFPPNIEYGSNSVEKNTQKQRENGVLQAIVFHNAGFMPNDPSEPAAMAAASANAAPLRFETKPIPLDDDEAEDEALTDYSNESWPEPVPDAFIAMAPPCRNLPAHSQSEDPNNESLHGQNDGNPRTRMFMESMQAKLKNMLGPGGTDNQDKVNMVLRAAEEVIRDTGFLPGDSDGRNPPPFMEGGPGHDGNRNGNNRPPFYNEMDNHPYEPTNDEMDPDGYPMEDMYHGQPHPGDGNMDGYERRSSQDEDYPNLVNGVPEHILQQSILQGLRQNVHMMKDGSGLLGAEPSDMGPNMHRQFNSGESHNFRGGRGRGGESFRGGRGWVGGRGGRGRGGGGGAEKRGGGAPFSRGGGGGGRGGSNNFRGNGGGWPERGSRGGPPRGGGGPPSRRPCRYWTDLGYCRDGDRCRFLHAPR